eukprot:1044218-Rhodomonas_salina.1
MGRGGTTYMRGQKQQSTRPACAEPGGQPPCPSPSPAPSASLAPAPAASAPPDSADSPAAPTRPPLRSLQWSPAPLRCSEETRLLATLKGQARRLAG